MSVDSPDEPPPYVMGPPPDYDPPLLEDLVDPEVHEHTHTAGRDLILAVLADGGIRKTENGWTRETPDRGETP